MAISMLKIRRPLGRLIFNMGIAIPGKTVFLIETDPWCFQYACQTHIEQSQLAESPVAIAIYWKPVQLDGIHIKIWNHVHFVWGIDSLKFVNSLRKYVHALWDQRHEGATRLSKGTRCVASSDLTYWVVPGCLLSLNVRYHHVQIRL